jgi:hypothetical protein
MLGAIIFMMAGTSFAQTVKTEQRNEPAPWLFEKSPKQPEKIPTPPEKATEPAPARNEKAQTGKRPASDKNAPSQKQNLASESSPSSGWQPPRDSYGSCAHWAPDQEDFLCMIGRILFGSGKPLGPNRDVDENISAGGAGG